MRHRKDGRRLGRNGPHRKAMLRNMVTSLLEHGRIRTTETRAKEVRRLAERLITLGKRAPAEGIDADPQSEERQQWLHQYRQVLKVVRSRDVARKVMTDYAESFRERQGGYTRMFKLGFRKGDNAPLSIIELVGYEPNLEDGDMDFSE